MDDNKETAERFLDERRDAREKQLERVRRVKEIASKYGFSDHEAFGHDIESAINAYRQFKSGREVASETVKRLRRQANGGETKVKSLLETLSIEREMLRGASDLQEAAGRAADNLKGGTRGRAAQGLFIERMLAVWYASHGVPKVVSGWDEDTKLRGPFVDFLEEVANLYGVVWEKLPRHGVPSDDESPWQTIKECLKVLKDRVRGQDNDS